MILVMKRWEKIKKIYLGDQTARARGNCHWADYLWDRQRQKNQE